MNRILVMAVVVVELSLASARAHAQSAPTCFFDTSNGVITLTVDGDAASLWVTNGGRIRLNGVNCGTATVDNTGTINVNGGARPDTVTLKGSFIPGASFEAGEPEIEIYFDLGAGSDTVKVNGSIFSDTFIFSTGGIDVRDDGDQDITTAGVETVKVYGLSGNDIIDGTRRRGRRPARRPR